jgi:prepilin-type N-terminal cleavage/methylation domain-containing protein
MDKVYRPSCRFAAFSLVELLIVIAIIAVISALALSAFSKATNDSIIKRAQAERTMLELAINNYHDQFGFYPPGNASTAPSNLVPALTNQLYYELMGSMTNNNTTPVSYTTLDNLSTLSSSVVSSTFGVGGFMNCSKGSGDDKTPSKSFLSGLKSFQMATNSSGVVVIVTAVNSPGYAPMPGFHPLDGPNSANPWRYLCPGINNPNSYDLWLQMVVGGKTNLICNWKDQVNSPLP